MQEFFSHFENFGYTLSKIDQAVRRHSASAVVEPSLSPARAALKGGSTPQSRQRRIFHFLPQEDFEYTVKGIRVSDV